MSTPRSPQDRCLTRLSISLARGTPASVTDQISAGLRAAIADGRLPPGGRLPSLRDLSAQLGVARGTVRAAYERLIDEGLVASAGARGTRVTGQVKPVPAPPPAEAPLPGDITAYPQPTSVFQMGVPAHDAFPQRLWTRTVSQVLRASSSEAQQYPDPRGHEQLRARIAAHLALARGIDCHPSQVFVTTGYASALSVAVQALELAGATAWVEDPGYPVTRQALVRSGVHPVPVQVDVEGLDVAAGLVAAPRAALAVVTPGQQAPLGVTLSGPRRQALLDWSARTGSWIFEDDYLGELQLSGRAAPALGAGNPHARVIHMGTFSKTMSPGLRLGFLMVPPAEAARFSRWVSWLSPSPAGMVQRAMAGFMEGGHYLRHLRRMKRLYAARLTALVASLNARGATHRPGGLAVLLKLPAGVCDVTLARAAQAHDLSPVPLSPWYAGPQGASTGLLLGVTNLQEREAPATCDRLLQLIAGTA